LVEQLDAGVLGDIRLPDPDDIRTRIERTFAPLDPTGGMAAECWRDYARKLERAQREDLAGSWRSFRDEWEQHRAVLTAVLVDPARLGGALRAAGAGPSF